MKAAGNTTNHMGKNQQVEITKKFITETFQHTREKNFSQEYKAIEGMKFQDTKDRKMNFTTCSQKFSEGFTGTFSKVLVTLRSLVLRSETQK